MVKRADFKIVRTMKILFGICFLLMCAGIFYLVYVEHCEAEKRQALTAIHEQESETFGILASADGAGERAADENDGVRKHFTELSGINGEYLGWLTVDGSGVNLPVVLGEDNSFYLNHDFYKEKSSYGTLFADCLTRRGQDGNLLIYGHHMKNGSMFGSLTSYCDREFFQEHKRILWETEEDSFLYEIFAVLVVPGEESDPDYLPIRNYLGRILPEDGEILLTELKNRALIWRNLAVTGEDDLLFLMTCDYTKKDGRLLLCAVRME
jgi:sortase B